MNFFKDVVSHLLKNAFEGHTKFSVADNTAVGDNPVRSISLDAVPVNNEVIISLSWDGGEKLFEKNLSDQEASHQFDLIAIDLSEVADLTKRGEYDAAKDLMKKLGQKYAENTGDIIDTNLPKLNTTMASKKDEHRPGAGKTECKYCNEKDCDYSCDESQAGGFGTESAKDANIWKQAKITMQNLWFSTTDELMEYQQKQKDSQPKTDQDHIPLWDAEKGKAPAAKDELAPASLSYEDVENKKEQEHEDMQKHIDEKIKTELESALQEKAASVFGPDQIELVKVLRKNGRNWDEIKKILVKDFNFDKDSTNIFIDEQRESLDPTGIEVKPVEEKEEPKSPLTPPEDLVSPETHDKLLQDHEDKKKDDSPVKEIENIEEPIKEESAQKCPECGEALEYGRHSMNGKPCGLVDGQRESNFTPQDIMAISELDEIARADNDEIHKVAAPSDLNPLQEPIQEDPTTPTTPPQDVIPMGKPKDHNAPQHGDRVFVTTDLSNEKSGYEAKFIQSIKGDHGQDFAIVETDQGDVLNIELNRVVKISEGTSGAQDVEPVMEPTIEKPTEEKIKVTPKMDDFHTSSQDPLLDLKIEAEALLKDIDNMGKTSYMFIKKGLEKHADDSAFEGNGWCRVWVQEDEIASDKRYAEALKLPDEDGKIAALKDIARELAHEALRLADSAGAKVGVQSWFESLQPSRHDRIDWVALANPQQEEVESSLEPKIEKKADDQDFKSQGFTQTDPDTNQWVKQVSDTAFQVYEQGHMLDIDLADYTPQQMEDAVRSYYGGGVAEVQKTYGKQANQIIAEILAESSDATLEASKKTANSMDTKCEDCGKPLGPEVFLSKWPVCGDCTRKKHKKVTGADETLPAEVPAKSKNPSLKDKDIDPYKHHSNLEWAEGDPCKLCKSPIDSSCQCTNAECEFHRMGQAFAATKPEGSEPDQVDLIMAYESGELDEAGILKLFSMLIKSGDAWSLQGSYGRTAKALIEAGYINENGTITKDSIETEIVPEQKLLSSKYAFKKQADEPAVEPKTQFKELKITPKYVEKEKATPASPELDQVLSKMDSLEQNLSTLETARKQIEAKMKEELAKIDQQGERVQMEAELQASIEKAAILIDAVESKIVAWKDKLYTLKTEEVSYVPKLTPKEMLAKIYIKFEGAEKYVQDVLNGMLSQAKNVTERTLVRWPNKKSNLSKEASILDDMNHYNEELLAALRELSTPL